MTFVETWYSGHMSDPYDFQNVVAIKLLIKNGDKILLVREPEFNEWMPNRLGLPGGKPLLNETLEEAVARKIQAEVGLEVKINGIVKIIDIIMPQKTVYHLLLAAEYISGEIGATKTESDDVQWYSYEQVASMSKDDFTEYYNDKFIKLFLTDSLAILPLDFIHYQDNRTDAISNWMSKGQ